MSTSLLYHAFGVRGYDYVRTDYQEGQVIFTIEQDPEDCRCPICGGRDVTSRGHVWRRFRSLPIGARPTSVALPIPRVECRACGLVRQVAVSFADPRRSFTRLFERFALDLGRQVAGRRHFLSQAVEDARPAGRFGPLTARACTGPRPCPVRVTSESRPSHARVTMRSADGLWQSRRRSRWPTAGASGSAAAPRPTLARRV